MELLNDIFKEYSSELVHNISQNYNINKEESYNVIYNLFIRNLSTQKPLASDAYEELIESGYYNNYNKRVQFRDEFNSVIYKIVDYINEKYKDGEFGDYLLEQSLI